jgi:hypothetical protein
MNRRARISQILGAYPGKIRLFSVVAVTALLLWVFNWLSPNFQVPDEIYQIFPGESLLVEQLEFSHDQDGDGLNDLDDIVQGAYIEAEHRPRYKSAYYSGGYPPDDEGVCTDVIWRALQNAGYSLKDLVDQDIRQATADYPRVAGSPDPNIDFRRVKNLTVFFRKYADSLTSEVIPGDAENLREWQRGDIVVFADPLSHIGIVSDRRRRDGVPYLIHNGGPYTREEDVLTNWPSPIIYHFRFSASV